MPTTNVQYVYSIAQDTLNGKVHLNNLKSEIQEEDILIALAHIDAFEDVLVVWFKGALSSPEQSLLATILAAHTGEGDTTSSQTMTLVDGEGSPISSVIDDGVTRLAIDFSNAITGPKGDTGDIGPAGEVGAQGPAGSTSVFGTYYRFIKSDVTSSTTSSSYQQKLRLTTDSLPAGKYRIGWAAEIESSDKDMLVRVQLNDLLVLNEFEYGTKDSWVAVGGFEVFTLLPGIHNIDIDYNDDGGGTASIRKAKLEIWRVS